MGMKKRLMLGLLSVVLVCAVVLTGCLLETDYTLINKSSYFVSGTVGSNPFSVSSGSTTTAKGSTLADIITYSPADKVDVTVSGGGFTATFTNK
jgi:hypothetical protein